MNQEQDQGEYDAPTRAEQPPTSNQDHDYPTDVDTDAQLAQPDWSDANPIPVYVVERPETPQVLQWSSMRAVIDANPVEIVGSRRNRTRVIIKNDGTNTVFLGPDMTVSTEMSYGLLINEEIEMLHNGAVWARCIATESATLNVSQEYTVELDSPHG